MARQPGDTTQTLVERRITDLHSRLHITSQQTQPWDQFAQVMRDNAREMDAIYKQRAERFGAMTAVDNMQSYAQIEQQRAQDVQKLVPAFQTLYASLSDQQKKTADEIFRNYAENAQARHQAAEPRQAGLRSPSREALAFAGRRRYMPALARPVGPVDAE